MPDGSRRRANRGRRKLAVPRRCRCQNGSGGASGCRIVPRVRRCWPGRGAGGSSVLLRFDDDGVGQSAPAPRRFAARLSGNGDRGRGEEPSPAGLGKTSGDEVLRLPALPSTSGAAYLTGLAEVGRRPADSCGRLLIGYPPFSIGFFELVDDRNDPDDGCYAHAPLSKDLGRIERVNKRHFGGGFAGRLTIVVRFASAWDPHG